MREIQAIMARQCFSLFALEQEVRWRSFTYRNTNTRIEKAVLGNEAGLYGAAYLPIQAQQVPKAIRAFKESRVKWARRG